MASDKIQWPPDAGALFIRSREFGKVLIAEAKAFTLRYGDMDFTDGVATVFTWLDKKLNDDPSFINASRFPSTQAFFAYIRHALWNSARLQGRKRQRRGIREMSWFDKAITDLLSKSTSRVPLPHDMLVLAERIDALPEPHRTVVNALVFGDDNAKTVSDVLRLSEAEIAKIFEEALARVTPMKKTKRRLPHRASKGRTSEDLLEFVNSLQEPDKSIFNRVYIDGPDNDGNHHTFCGSLDMTAEQLCDRAGSLLDRWMDGANG